MAQKVTVQLVDDLDGTQAEDISTVTFGLDGVTYEIDLSDTNADNLRGTLQEFVVNGRRTGGRVKRGNSTRATVPGMPHEHAQTVREWARKNGLEVSARGRIAASIMEAFEVAQAETAQAEATQVESRTKSRRRRAKASA